MTLFGGVKLDKLRTVYLKREVVQEDRLEIETQLTNYFPDHNLSNKYGNILSTFTPTKLIRNSNTLLHNLQMPPEDELLQALEDITLHSKYIKEKCGISIIHLAKDVLLKQDVISYLDMLCNRPYSRIEAKLIESEGITSLYYTFPHDIYSDNNVVFRIKLYDKSAEYYKKHGTYICKLNEPLTQEEIKEVGGAYHSNTNTLDLSKLNILRCEIELQGADKVKPITNILAGVEPSKLTLALLMKDLRSGTLYYNLDTVFSTILKKYVFSATEELETAIADVTAIKKLSITSLYESGAIYDWKVIADELELSNQFSEMASVVNKIVPDSELYDELYSKLITNIAPRNKEKKLLGRFHHSSYFKQLAQYLLVYDVPILDDS